MAHIEHIALWAADLESLCAFYTAHFGAVPGPRYENPAKGFASRFLTFASGARLEVMSTTALTPATRTVDAPQTGLTHLAIALGSEAAVDALTERLRGLGLPVLDGPRRTGDAYYESLVLDPEGNRLELTV